jgi:hypothetical protein
MIFSRLSLLEGAPTRALQFPDGVIQAQDWEPFCFVDRYLTISFLLSTSFPVPIAIPVVVGLVALPPKMA